MARIELEVGETFIFQTEIPVRISDINYGHHVGNDSFISLIHEAKIRFFNSLGYTETDIEGKALVISDLAATYKSQSFYGDILCFEIAPIPCLTIIKFGFNDIRHGELHLYLP